MKTIEQLTVDQKALIKRGFESMRHYVRFNMSADPFLEAISDANGGTIIQMLRIWLYKNGGNLFRPQIHSIFSELGYYKDGIMTLKEYNQSIKTLKESKQKSKNAEIENEVKELLEKRKDLDNAIGKLNGMKGRVEEEINDETVKKMDELKKEMEALGRKKRDDILDEARTINNTVPDVKIRTKIPINMALDKVRSMTKLERDKLTIKQIRGVLDTIDVVYKTKGKLNKPYYMALMDKALEV